MTNPENSSITPEDRRAEYTALRAEILDSDRTCLLMMGYIFAAVGFLYANDSEWLVSLVSFVGLCYFTFKRFGIRLISSYIANMGGFEWDKKVPEYRKEGKLRPVELLRPYNVEAFTCLFVAVSPLFNGIYNNLGKLIADLFFDLSNNLFKTEFNDLKIFIFEPFCKRFGQLNPNLTDCFWLIFLILTFAYSLFSVIKYNFLLTDNNKKNNNIESRNMFPTMRHPSRYVWDFWYYFDPDTKLFHVFYLNADQFLVPLGKHHFASRVGYATTYDFIRMDWGDKNSFDILHPPVNHWANTSIWSGDIIKIQNGYLLFFTSRDHRQDDGMTQNIGVAFTRDLDAQDWQIQPMRIQPQYYYQPRSIKDDLSIHAWRDPFLFLDQEYVYLMLSAKSVEDSIGRNGAVGLLRTNNDNFARVIQGEAEWQSLYPLSKPSCYSEMEVPQLYQDEQDNYELVFSTWKDKDFASTTGKAGGIQGVTFDSSWNFENTGRRSIESDSETGDFHVLMPESHGLYACRIIPELEGEIVGFDIKHGGIRRSGVKTNFKSVNRDFSFFSLRLSEKSN